MLDAGAAAYLTKGALGGSFATTIRAVSDGREPDSAFAVGPNPTSATPG
jgi:hypothetical protein